MTLAAIQQNLALNLAQVSGLSSKAITGTVAKVAASATVTGTGTVFLSQLYVGSIISIPGTAVEYFVVTAIASDTSLTIHTNAVNNASGQTVTTYAVYLDEPNETPTNELCPCIVLTLPRITPRAPYQGIIKQIYHFQILYLYTPYEISNPREATSAISAYLSNVWTPLFAAFLLGTNAMTQDFDGDVTRPLAQFRGIWFWGYQIPWAVEDRTTATFTA